MGRRFRQLFVYMGMEECLILDKNSFVEGTDINFKELLTAVAGLKKRKMEMSMKNNADALIFFIRIFVLSKTNIPNGGREIACANFSSPLRNKLLRSEE